MRADPDHDPNHGDNGPQAEHRAPIEQAIEAGASGCLGSAVAACLARTRLSLAWGVVVWIAGLAFGGRFLRHLVVVIIIIAEGNAILRAQTQFRKRCGEPELRLPASAAFFPSPRHT